MKGSIGAAELGRSLGPEHVSDPLAGTHRDRTYHEPVPSFSNTGTFFILIPISYSLSSLPPPLSIPAAPRSTMKLPWRLPCSTRASTQPTSSLSPRFLLLGIEGTGKGRQGKVPAVEGTRHSHMPFHSIS